MGGVNPKAGKKAGFAASAANEGTSKLAKGSKAYKQAAGAVQSFKKREARRKQSVRMLSHGFMGQLSAIDSSGEGVEAEDAATRLQAATRRMLASSADMRQTVAEEVNRRVRERVSKLSEHEFSLAGEHMLRDMDRHSPRAESPAAAAAPPRRQAGPTSSLSSPRRRAGTARSR
jgi:hypothetical protein